MSKLKSIRSFFEDKHGRVVIFQMPNALLWGWLLSKLLMILGTRNLASGFGRLGTALLFAWAYLELTKGVNYFRKSLGLVVLLVVMRSFF